VPPPIYLGIVVVSLALGVVSIAVPTRRALRTPMTP